MKTREELLERIKKNCTCAELGIFEGEFSEKILNIVNPSKFYMVDIFAGEMMSADKNNENMKYIKNLELVYYALVKKYQDDKRVSIYKGTSGTFLDSMPDNSLDFVYIDANHSYEGVKLDIFKSYEKIKTGGFICGHDYNNVYHPGVVKAVDEFLNYYKHLKMELTTEDKLSSFLIEKIKMP